MEPGFIDLTAENIADQHLCCIIRSKKPHPGVEAKRRWLVDRLPEGHVFRKLDVKEKVFIVFPAMELTPSTSVAASPAMIATTSSAIRTSPTGSDFI